MRYAIPGMVILALLAIVYALGNAAGGKPASTPLERFAQGELSRLDFSRAGEAAPDWFEAYRGRPILVNFWATWCGPCERELPSLGALQTARGGDFEVVAVSVDGEDEADYARKRLQELTGGVLEFVHAPDYAPVYAVGAAGFPTTVFFGADGQEKFRLEGEADWASYEALALIDAALAGN